MKTKIRILSFALAMILFAAVLPIGSVSAADGETSYTKNKVVSVLFDNSGSMLENDRWSYAKYALQTLMATLGTNDTLIITADHGCDPTDNSTDHTREYVPLIVAGPKVKPVNLGTRVGFADIAATVTELLGVSYETPGKSLAKEILK